MNIKMTSEIFFGDSGEPLFFLDVTKGGDAGPVRRHLARLRASAVTAEGVGAFGGSCVDRWRGTLVSEPNTLTATASSDPPVRPAHLVKLKEWKARQLPRRLCKSVEHANSYALLGDSDDTCTKQGSLKGKAINCVRLLVEELQLEPVRDLPPVIRCGDLRSAVRGCFSEKLPLQAELSIKTSQKLERSACRSCYPKFEERKRIWDEARLQPQEVDQQHLDQFRRRMRENIPAGWNRKIGPFIPNGKASRAWKRSEGGNWNEEPFSELCRRELVISSGKPRIVTLYSSYNSSVLKPLHDSLFSLISKQGWLLVGPPTVERVQRLTGGGDYLSFDYASATDNIKRAYVSESVESLIQRADPELSDDQKRCLRVLSTLDFGEGAADSGQPMGSLMSFPLLCLVNKTVVDLALTDLLQGGQLSFKEWTSHRCLINGDDLLTREPRKETNLAERVFHHGSKVGLKTNFEKTLKSEFQAEINSTLFERGELVKKTNVASLYMKPETTDVLGYALEATSTLDGFRRVVRANCKYLALQERKGYRDLPIPLQRLCKRDRKIRQALLSGPADPDRTRPPNLFPVSPRPVDYGLTREEEVELINRRVEKVRDMAVRIFSGGGEGEGSTEHIVPLLKRNRARLVKEKSRTWRSVKYEKRPPRAEEVILDVLAQGWQDKQKRQLAEEVVWNPLTREIGPSDLPGGTISRLIDAVRAFRNAKDLRCGPITLATSRELTYYDFGWKSEFETGSEWIALE
ncbi:RNA-dependent RNA polymerase [Erysiphe necator associated ourmia-like virus 115]|nr:RNA-dependent RNA polymerase [Erysiphe necator associated ourmia-like virus 115]